MKIKLQSLDEKRDIRRIDPELMRLAASYAKQRTRTELKSRTGTFKSTTLPRMTRDAYLSVFHPDDETIKRPAEPPARDISPFEALGAMLLGVSAGFGLEAAAFVGALAAMWLVFGLARGDGSWTQTRLLLTGVIVAAGCGSAVALMLSLAPDQQLRGMLFWLMGDASQAGNPIFVLLILLAGLLLALFFARELNLLTRGPLLAATLGANVGRLRLVLYFLASLLTAAAVTSVGSVGFVGLVVPHLVRLALGNDQRLLLPAATLAGGALLTLADTLARSVIAPQQLPVGVLTALIGVPVFLFLLARSPRLEHA